MEDFAARMRRIIEELNEIQRKLQEALVDTSDPRSMPDQPARLEQVQDFKTAIDQMRHFLWFYVQAVSHECGGEKLIELLRQASRGEDADRATLQQINSLTDYAILHFPLPPDRKPN